MTPTDGRDPQAAGQASAGPRTAAAPTARRQPPRHVVRSYACPQCGAQPGEKCQGRRGERESNHYARVEAAWASLPSKSDRLAAKQRRLRAERAARRSVSDHTLRPTPDQSKTPGAEAMSRAAGPTPEGLTSSSTRQTAPSGGRTDDR